MTSVLPLILAVGYALLMLRFSVWQTNRTLAHNSRPLTDPAILAQAERMARALEIPRIEMNVFEVEPVNGLASADGRIYLTRGFLNAYERGRVTAEEMAAVIAHELGHVALGHMRRRMIDFTGQNAVFVLLSAVLNRFLPIIGIWIANLLSTALMARLSRKDEFEADAWAAALLTKSGIGIGPQISLFRKLGHLTGSAGEGIPAWIRSHPQTEERIAAIEAMQDRWAQVAGRP